MILTMQNLATREIHTMEERRHISTIPTFQTFRACREAPPRHPQCLAGISATRRTRERWGENVSCECLKLRIKIKVVHDIYKLSLYSWSLIPQISRGSTRSRRISIIPLPRTVEYFPLCRQRTVCLILLLHITYTHFHFGL